MNRASTAKQAYTTRFSQYFIPALKNPESDTNSDGKISILEAFTQATKEIEKWYRDREILPTESPSLEDDGDGEPSFKPWKYETDLKDGLAASKFYLVNNELN